jgi:hypothetical protein
MALLPKGQEVARSGVDGAAHWFLIASTLNKFAAGTSLALTGTLGRAAARQPGAWA